MVSYTEYVFICTGGSNRQIQALDMAIERDLKLKKIKPNGVEGKGAARWILLDYGDVIVHLFLPEARTLYDIEGIWPGAEEIKIPGYDRRDDLNYVNFA